MSGHKFSSIIAFWAGALLCGCGVGPSDSPELGDVSGTITVDGKPKANLTVSYLPENGNGRPASGTTDENGYYELRYSFTETGTKVGKNVVRISSLEPESDDDGDLTDAAEFVDPIPAKYNTQAADNPEMNVNVKPGNNEFDFNVDSSAAPNTRSEEADAPVVCGA